MVDPQDPAANPSDDAATHVSPDGVTINVGAAKSLVAEVIADATHAIKHNAPAAPSLIDRLKQALTHLGG